MPWEFPDPRTATEDGIVAIGGDMRPEILITAYSQGIFPWPIEGVPVLTWFCPAKRAILKFSNLHVARSLRQAQKKTKFTFTIDQAFSEVIAECATAKRGDWGAPGAELPSTWITPALKKAYIQFHKERAPGRGAHSVEVWDGKELVGGVYGVEVDGVFSAESMFFHKSNASKLALLHLVEHLRSRGAEWMDIQVMSKHMRALGATELSRERFLKLLSDTQNTALKLFDSYG
ncbi:MAG: leucyl/phenylalanyl-tRNA--protein transferase [Bacteriovoracia bacterium]